VVGVSYVIYRTLAVPPPPPKQPPVGQIGVKLELVRSPHSPALVRCVVTVTATAGTTPIDFRGMLTTTYAGAIPMSAVIDALNVPVVALDLTWEVPAGETETVTATGELSNPFNSYTLPAVSKSYTVPGEPPVGYLAVELVTA